MKQLATKYLPAFILAAFGGLTIFMAGSVIFDLFGIRAKEGNFVPFIVWTNFIAGWAYLAAAYGFVKEKKWTFGLLISFLVVLIAAFVGLKMHIEAGGIYEERTVKAMMFRMGVTTVMAIIAFLTINKRANKHVGIDSPFR